MRWTHGWKLLDDEERKLICELYSGDEELSIHIIGQRTKRAWVTIRQVLIDAGIELRTPSETQKLEIKHGRRVPKRTHWKGGRTKHHGYIRLYKPDHPRQHNGYIFEHIVVWEESHHQPLPDGWVVHHLNGIKDDNRPKNLEALPRRGHSPGLTVKEVQKRLREVEAELAQQRLV